MSFLSNLFNTMKDRGSDFIQQNIIPLVKKEPERRAINFFVEKFKPIVEQQQFPSIFKRIIPTPQKGINNLSKFIPKPQESFDRLKNIVSTTQRQAPNIFSAIAKSQQTGVAVKINSAMNRIPFIATPQKIYSQIKPFIPETKNIPAILTPLSQLSKRGYTLEQRKAGVGELSQMIMGTTEPLTGLGKKIIKKRAEKIALKIPESIQKIKSDMDIGIDVGLKKFSQYKRWEDKVNQSKIDNKKSLGLSNRELQKSQLSEKESLYKTKQQTNQNGVYIDQRNQKVSGIKKEKLGLPISEEKSQAYGYKTRGLIKTIKESKRTSDIIRKIVNSQYKNRNTKQLAIKAKNLVNQDLQMANDVAREGKSDISIATALELIKKHQDMGNFDSAIDLVEELAPKLTEAGRTIQATTLYNRLSPEGILRFTQRELNKVIAERPQLKSKIKLEPETAVKLVDMSKKIQKMPDGYRKIVETKKMLKEIHDIVPSAWSEKISTIQTMAQLLNPKTVLRNIIGNVGFQGLEGISQSVATPLDALTSLITKKRTTGLPKIFTQLSGMKKGFTRGFKESLEGINTGASTQFDLPQVAVFKNRVLGTLEKTMNVTLKAPDRATFQAAYDDTLKNLMRLNKTPFASPEMVEQATYTGLYRTFQDENAISNAFVGLKKILNTAGVGVKGKKFGLGDFILKYPKTPANLLARGIDYSPAGFIKTMFELTKPLIRRQFNQKAFVDSLSKATVGTVGLVGTGFYLGKLGIITESPSQDIDVRGIQKTTGQGSYQINVSALKRFVLSGFNPAQAKIKTNDILMSYDWIQPMAVSLSMGAKMANNNGLKDIGKNVGQAGLDSITSSVETLSEQPMISGLRDFVSGKKPVESFYNTFKSAPASFVPTILSQIRQLTDNTSRQTYDPDAKKEMLNLIKYKIPGLSTTLPESIDVFGKKKEVYQGGMNNPFNVFLVPAYITKYKPSKEAKEALRIMETTGETKQIPRVVSRNITINGESKSLKPEEINKMQKYVGAKTVNVFSQLLDDRNYQSLSDEEKAQKISSILSDIMTSAKMDLFGHKLPYNDSSVEKVKKGSYSLGSDYDNGSKTMFESNSFRQSTFKKKSIFK